MSKIPARDRKSEILECRPGPWGDLEYYDTFLEAPDALLKLLRLPSQQAVWHFVKQTPEEIKELFDRAELTREEKKMVADPGRWSVEGNRRRFFPPQPLIESLSTKSRAVIYATLAQWPENELHHEPIVFDRADLVEALDRSRVSPAFVQLISKLSYSHEGLTLFSDLPYLLRHLKHPREERLLLRVLTRTRTLLVRMRITKKTDLEAVADYWTVNRRHLNFYPLMQAIVRTRGVERLDLANVLPVGPRSQLYTYPSVADVLQGRAPDGLWTAMNFFNAEPSPIYLHSPGSQEHLRSTHKPVKEPYSFGDLLLVAPKDTRQVCHACVYIADDIVYTKNSASMLHPWILSTKEEMLSYQVRGRESVVSGWRKVF